MPRTELTVREIVRAGGVAITDAAVYTLFDRVNDMQFMNDGRTFLAVQNIHATNTYTLEFFANPDMDYDGLKPDPYQWIVAANSQRFVGPFPVSKFGNPVLVSSASAGAETNVRVTVYRLPQTGTYAVLPVTTQTIAPRQAMTITPVTRAAGGAAYGNGSGETTSDANNAHFPNDGQTFIHLRNTTGGAINTYVLDEGYRDGQPMSNDSTVNASIPANSERLVGPFPAGYCQFEMKHLARINWAAGLQAKAFWLPWAE